jgi:biotin carboxyl carrier protein
MKKLRITVEGKVYEVTVQVLEDDEATLGSPGYLSPLPPMRQPPRAAPEPTAGPSTLAPIAAPPVTPGPPAVPLKGDPKAILAPIAGTVQKVFVEAGRTVEGKAPVVLLDAMKMDTYIYAPRTMKVTDVAVKAGDAVQVGDRLIGCEPPG